MSEDDVVDEVDESSETEAPKKSSGPQPPYGGNIPAKWRNTPYDELPDNLKSAVKGS